jgi:hypothetical protein
MKAHDPAFPQPEGAFNCPMAGMTMREFYAGLAMLGFVIELSTHPMAVRDLCEEKETALSDFFARAAVICADSLIAELRKPQPQPTENKP